MSAAVRIDVDRDLLLEEHRERMAIVNTAVAEVEQMSHVLARKWATPRRIVDLNDPLVSVATKEAMRQEGLNRLTFPSKTYSCPGCVDGNRFQGAKLDTSAELLIHMIECPGYLTAVADLIGFKIPF